MIQDGEGVYSFPGGNVTYNGVSLGSTATYRTSVDYRVNGAQLLESTCEDEMWTPEAVVVPAGTFLLISPTQSYTSLNGNLHGVLTMCASFHFPSRMSSSRLADMQYHYCC